jgi:hypothetical protein
MRPPTRTTTLTALSAVPGAVLTCVGIFEDGQVDASDFRTVGVLLLVVTFGFLMLHRINQPAEAAYELGHAEGHTEGYDAGRRVARPTVVRIAPGACPNCATEVPVTVARIRG